MSKVLDRNQLSTKRVVMALENLGVNVDAFVAEYEVITFPRARKNRIDSFSDEQIEALREYITDRSPERELEVMAILDVKTRTTLDRIVADYATRLVAV